MLRFPFFGFPVSIHWMFWVVTALLGGVSYKLQRPDGLWEVGLWMAVVFISVLWHELGHCLFQKKYGAQPEIMLYGGGGLAIPHGGRFTRTQSFIIAAAGPAFGLMLWAFSERFFHYFPPAPLARTALLASYLFQVNLFWSLVNLLPVLPLDGGRLMEALLGSHRIRVVAGIGMIVALGTGIAAYSLLGQLYMAIMFGFFAYQNFQIWQRGSGSVEP